MNAALQCAILGHAGSTLSASMEKSNKKLTEQGIQAHYPEGKHGSAPNPSSFSESAGPANPQVGSTIRY